MKVRINATGDTIVLKFVRPNPDIKLEGYILGYGSSMFSKQYIQLPENGEPYETEIDAEPKYLVAVQPIPTNEVKKQCTGKVSLDKPLHLVIGSVTPTSVLLSWGTLLKTPYEGNVMNDCLEDGHYTVRYRERNRKWNYQTCPTSDTVIDNLKPNTPYEFGVRANQDKHRGVWSKHVVHNTNMSDKSIQKPFKPVAPNAKPVKPSMAGPNTLFPVRPDIHNRTQPKAPTLSKNPTFPGAPRTSLAPPKNHPDQPPSPVTRPQSVPQRPQLPLDVAQPHSGSVSTFRNVVPHSTDILPVTSYPQILSTKPPSTSASPTTNVHQNGAKHQGQTQAWAPSNTQRPLTPLVPRSTSDTLGEASVPHTAPGHSQDKHSLPSPTFTSEKTQNNDWDETDQRSSTFSIANVPQNLMAVAMPTRNPTSQGRDPLSPSTYDTRQHFLPRATDSSQTSTRGASGEHDKEFIPPKPVMWPKMPMGSPAQRPSLPASQTINQVDKHEIKGKDNEKVIDLKQTDEGLIPKPNTPPATAKPTKHEQRQTTTTAAPVVAMLNVSRFDMWDNSSVFSPVPSSEVDAMGKPRFIAPHVIYKTDKKPEEPCSITNSLSYFPEEDVGELNVTGPPRAPPSNLTVVTVEGCPSFIILDWEKGDNETTDYEVTSTAKGPDGEEVSVLITNQTHTAVENLKPNSSYEFKVKPFNELGEGPSTEAVAFNTESADPRVSENVSGKDAIWTQFPFKSDSYSDCNGRQYVKRTWYRKFVGIQLCNSLRYKIYLSDSLTGKFYNIGDQTGHGEDHCQFVDSFLDGRTGSQLLADQLPSRTGFYRAMRQEPVNFGQIGGNSHITYVSWYECGTPIPGKW
ncbi:target of Nesh-SH3-like [Megalops cyprinoides]|uniref:target of Nesh-SH3-like n=1 Tax=Megalops cyprinoides TaxID=118141 RepID=UPI0018642535|nr:target of Nesh-SH3-like [Megalops cyprinoides]